MEASLPRYAAVLGSEADDEATEPADSTSSPGAVRPASLPSLLWGAARLTLALALVAAALCGLLILAAVAAVVVAGGFPAHTPGLAFHSAFPPWLSGMADAAGEALGNPPSQRLLLLRVVTVVGSVDCRDSSRPATV